MFGTNYIEFEKKWANTNAEKIHGGKIIEVSYKDNFRDAIKKMNPEIYFNISPKEGPGVDKVLHPYYLIDFFGKANFDVVICDLLQYSQDWKRVVWTLNSILNVEGILIIATRSINHQKEHPSDYWRFTTNNLYEAFRGYSIQELKDCPDNGILFAGMKREIYTTDISGILAHEVNEC